jgi:fatty acyl-CoA reductase
MCRPRKNDVKDFNRLISFQVFVHTSTAYCYCDKDSTEEIVFPPNEDPYDVIHLTEWMPSDLLEKITPE